MSTEIALPAPPAADGELASEHVILSAPMSYAGATARLMRRFKGMRVRIPRPQSVEHPAAKVGVVALVVLGTTAIYMAAAMALLMVYAAITVWYGIFGLLLVPYRLIRRGNRKRKMEGLRHRELMGTIESTRR